MIKLTLILIMAVIAALFAVLNPHPVAINFFPDETALLPLRIIVVCAALTGFLFGSVVFGMEIAGLYSRIRKLKKKIDTLEASAAAPAAAMTAKPADGAAGVRLEKNAVAAGVKKDTTALPETARKQAVSEDPESFADFGKELSAGNMLRKAVPAAPSVGQTAGPEKSVETVEEAEEILSEKDKIINSIKWFEEDEKGLFEEDEKDGIPEDKLEEVKKMIGAKEAEAIPSNAQGSDKNSINTKNEGRSKLVNI